MLIHSFAAMVALAGATSDHMPLVPPSTTFDGRGNLASIELWSNHDDGVTHRGDAVRVYFRTDRDAYVTILRVDTDGRVRILFPEGPWENNFARRDRRYEVRATGARHAFIVDDDPGQGYVFAVTSVHPFRYREIVTGARWDYRYVANDGRIVGDPYVALLDLVDVIVPATYDGYDYDVVPYYVGHRYEYPRFLCYDCHSYVRYAAWDPYDRACFEFRVIAYNDPYYYPARRYPGTHVVFTRPKRLEPRYVFVKRIERGPDIVVEPRRPAPESRRPATRSWTSRDVGGVGRIPAPVTDPRTTPRRAPTAAPATSRRISPTVEDSRRPDKPTSPRGSGGQAQPTPRRESSARAASDTVRVRRVGAQTTQRAQPSPREERRPDGAGSRVTAQNKPRGSAADSASTATRPILRRRPNGG